MTNRLSEVEYEGEDIVEPIKNKIDGTKLKNVRLEKEILINKIAEFLCIKPIQYCDVEHGRQYMYIGENAQKKLAEFLGIDDIKKVLVDEIEQFEKKYSVYLKHFVLRSEMENKLLIQKMKLTITQDEIHKLALQFEQEQKIKGIVLVNQPVTRGLDITYTPEFVEWLLQWLMRQDPVFVTKK